MLQEYTENYTVICVTKPRLNTHPKVSLEGLRSWWLLPLTARCHHIAVCLNQKVCQSGSTKTFHVYHVICNADLMLPISADQRSHLETSGLTSFPHPWRNPTGDRSGEWGLGAPLLLASLLAHHYPLPSQDIGRSSGLTRLLTGYHAFHKLKIERI